MEKKYSKYGYGFIAPFFLVFATFSLYPVFYTLYLSFTRYPGYGKPEFIGLKPYSLVLQDSMFWESLSNTIRMWGVNIVLQIALAVVLVMIFSDIKYKVKGLKFFRVVYYLPNLISAAVVAMIFAKVLDSNYGILNEILGKMGFITEPIKWLTKPFLAQMSVSGVQTWMWFGNSFILFIASVQAVSKDLFEAARVDGANRFQILRNITIPSIKPIVIYVLITGLIGGLQLFDIPYLLTDGLGAPSGGLNTVVVYIYNKAFTYNAYGIAAAASYILFTIITIVAIVFLIMGNRSSIKAHFAKRKEMRLSKEGGRNE